jgi:hypothetical protein
MGADPDLQDPARKVSSDGKRFGRSQTLDDQCQDPTPFSAFFKRVAAPFLAPFLLRDRRGQPGNWPTFLSQQERRRKETGPAAPSYRIPSSQPSNRAAAQLNLAVPARDSDSARLNTPNLASSPRRCRRGLQSGSRNKSSPTLFLRSSTHSIKVRI